MLFDGGLPPLPGFAVEWAVCVCVDGVDATPVADEEELIGAVGVFPLPACLAEDYDNESMSSGKTVKMG
jgi:hypothetical protein